VVGVGGMAHAEKEPDYQDGESADHFSNSAQSQVQHSQNGCATHWDYRIDEKACETRELGNAVASDECGTEDEPQSHRGHREKSGRRSIAHSNTPGARRVERVAIGLEERT
jgi:hypothetical protein